MATHDELQALTEIQPLIARAMEEAEASDLPGPAKREKVLDFVGAVYEGLEALGKLDGTKELKGVKWASLAPLVGVAIDASTSFYKGIKRWRSKRDPG